jgi:quinol monooxygenase YgiN
LWVTEVWEDTASHQASLGLPQVKAAIQQARPLIASFEHRTETEPVAGIGL